jgi:cytochrome c oxidase subunit 2
MHKYERWWMTFGIAMLFVFLVTLGVAAVAQGINPATDTKAIDPAKLALAPPFDHPGVRVLPDGTYEAYYIARVFAFDPATITVPIGKKITFYVTSADVVHGFYVAQTDVNMMAVPGWVNTTSHTFTRKGTYLLLCHEYCGIGHENMFAKIEVH